MDHIFQCVIFLFSYHIQASRAVTSVFVQKGRDVHLEVKEADVLKDFLLLVWKFNGANNIVSFLPGGKPQVSGLYTGKVEFSVTNYTVKLKNVQETDSGDYTARFTGADKEQTTVHSVTVQAAVSPVNLTVDSVSSSSVSCNLTVTCRTQDSHIRTTFTCVNQNCSEDGYISKSTTSGAVLHVYLENNSINCNHSNQVSWTTNQGGPEIQDVCHQDPIEAWSHITLFVIVPVIIIIIIMGIIVAVSCYLKNRKNKTFRVKYTAAADPRGQTQQRFSVSDNSNLSPTSTYCLVGFHTGSAETRHALTQTVYAEVEPPAC